MKRLPTDPRFCYISPINTMQVPVDVYQGEHMTHLVLAHLVDLFPVYAEFYKNRSIEGDFIIMDNSAYELKVPYAPEKLLALGKMCGADAIVLPDYPFQHSGKTVEAAERFAPIFLDAGIRTFFVPQSEKGNTSDWLDAYEWAAQSDLVDIIGCSILGIPNALPDIEPAYARVVMMQMLSHAGQVANKYHHFLGLNAGPALEIPSLLRMGVLNSIDSSGPVWAAFMGHAYTKEADSLQTVRKLTLPVDFTIAKPKPETIQRIVHNIEMTETLFRHYEVRTWFAEE